MKDIHSARFSKLFIGSLAIGLCAVPGCGHDNMDTMSNHWGVFDDQATRFQTAVDSHGTAVASAEDLPRIARLETDHASSTEPHMNAMRHELGDMMGCTGPAGERPASSQVMGNLDQLEQESDDHMAAMGEATDLASAGDEETRHQGKMTQMMADLRTNAGSMMNGTGDYDCPHHMR